MRETNREEEKERMMRKKNCELCGGSAKVYCESDDASLCWDCDEKVHAANFLVAKHTRCLLCIICHSLTPWMACAPRLGSTVSICYSCNIHRQQQQVGPRSEIRTRSDGYEDEGEDSYDDEDDDDLDDEEADNQVVPWTDPVAELKLPAVVASSSSSISGGGGPAIKRTRESFDLLSSDDEIPCTSSQPTDNPRPLKYPKEDEPGESDSGSTARINSLQRLITERDRKGRCSSSTISPLMSRDLSR